MLRKLQEHKLRTAICFVVLLLLISGISYLALTNHPVPGGKKTEVIAYSTDNPDETKPNDDYNWKGADNDPKKIIIPSLGIDSYIQNVGVDQNREIAVPNNIHLAGWFIDSVRPGNQGLSIIDGHLNGRQTDGIFANLGKIETGAQFTIEFGDASKRTFVVKNTQIINLNKAASVLYSQDPSIDSQLNLITCGGNFNPNARLYDKRVIVVSELVKSD